MGAAHDAVKKVQVGAEGKAKAGSGESELEVFRVHVQEFRQLAAQGVIEIIEEHPETGTGKHYIDFVRFRRLA